MSPSLVGLLYGMSLVVVGLAAYFLNDAQSVTALFPAFAGVLVLIGSTIARMKPAWKMHAMHGVALLMVVVMIGTGFRLVSGSGADAAEDGTSIPEPPGEGTAEIQQQEPTALEGSQSAEEASDGPGATPFLIAVVVLSVIGLIFMVKSFIDARRARDREEGDREGPGSGGRSIPEPGPGTQPIGAGG